MPRHLRKKSSSPRQKPAAAAAAPVLAEPTTPEPIPLEPAHEAISLPLEQPTKKTAVEPIDLCDSDVEMPEPKSEPLPSSSTSSSLPSVPLIEAMPEYLRPFCWEQVDGTLYSRDSNEFKGMYNDFVERVLAQLQRHSGVWQAEYKHAGPSEQRMQVFRLLKERYYSPVFLDEPSSSVTPTVSSDEDGDQNAAPLQTRRFRSSLKVTYESARVAKEDGSKAKAPTLTLNLTIEPKLPLEQWIEGRLLQEYTDRKGTFASTAAMDTAHRAHLDAMKSMSQAFATSAQFDSFAKRNCFRGTRQSDRRQITLPAGATLEQVMGWQRALIRGFNLLAYAQLPELSDSWYAGVFTVAADTTGASKKKRKRTPSPNSSPVSTILLSGSPASFSSAAAHHKRRRVPEPTVVSLNQPEASSPQQLIEARLRPKLQVWLNEALKTDYEVPFYALASRYLEGRTDEFRQTFPFITADWVVRCFRSILDEKLASLTTLLD